MELELFCSGISFNIINFMVDSCAECNKLKCTHMLRFNTGSLKPSHYRIFNILLFLFLFRIF